MIVLWYLGYGRYLAELGSPTASLDEFYAGVSPDSTDEDTDSN
jgi:hypothetical protein